ncbi:MAG: T9SS type A sorting domain-containing protein [bacterium]|nr:T9SS type A sorting domain-containing protein [bacterium]
MRNKSLKGIIVSIFIAGILSAQTKITISNTTGDQILPTVCKGKSSYLVCWVDNRAGINTDRVYGKIIAEHRGVLPGIDFLITSTPSVSKPIITFNPTNNKFLVTNFGWNKGFFVPENVQSIDSTNVWMSEDGMHPEAMCFDGDKYFMVFYCTYGANKHKLLGKFFSENGEAIDDSLITIDELYIPKDISVAFNGNQYLVVWSDDRRAGIYDIYAQLLSKEGTPLPNDFCISYEDWIVMDTLDESSPKVSSDGTNWFVIWEGDYQIKGRIVYPNSQLGDSTITLIDDKDSYFPALSFNGEMYIVSASTIDEFNIVMIARTGEVIKNQCFLQNEPVYWTDICADKFGYLTVFNTKNTQDYDLYGMFANTEIYAFPDTSIFKIISNPFIGFARVTGYTGELQIYDVSGRKVETANITNEWTTFGNNLKHGVYFAKPRDNCGIKTFKIVKMR